MSWQTAHRRGWYRERGSTIKPIDIFKKQYAEARATQLRFAEKGLQSALLGANQAAAQARTILDAARFDDENHKEAQFVLAIEKFGLFEKAFGLANAKTTAAAKIEANKIIKSNNITGMAVIFLECKEVLIKEAKKWSDVK